ncbi:MAG: hypothetical protein ACI4PF_04160 [Christensenellales bacterium]
MLNASGLLATSQPSGGFTSVMASLFEQMGIFLSSTGGMQTVALISLAVFIFSVIICIILISRTYESRLLKCVINFNRYFKKNPYVNEDNLVEVNQKFKQVPKTLRYCWTEYMLNRDRQPSEYINSVSCIDQPTRSSSYKSISTTVLLITIMVSVLNLIANLIYCYGIGVSESASGLPAEPLAGWFLVLLVPVLILFVGLFIVTFLKNLEASRYADLYYEFHEFERYLNKACSTMPAFVDYEVLFDAKEIKEAIPVLQEYLEKRALQEQKEAEEAEMNANHFEDFNFEPVGVESALLLDRAMSEGERYFNFKRGLTERINSKETEMFNFQKKFDEVTKEYERKSQAVRENMASINEQLNATSVKIEANYLKKRYNEEQQKQQQLEKDYEYAQINFTKQQQEMEQEINQLTNEIKEKKAQVEENMMSECRNYSNKVWGEINKSIQAQQEPILKEKEEKAKNLQNEIDKMTLIVADQDADIRAKQEYISKLEQDIKVRIAEIEAINNVRDYFNTPDFRQRISDKKKRRKPDDFDDEDEEVESKNQIASIVSDNRESELKQEENELLNKLKEVNKANSEYAEEVEAIKQRQQEEEDKVSNPFASFASLQKELEDKEENNSSEEPVQENKVEDNLLTEQTPEQTAEQTPSNQVSSEKTEENNPETPKKNRLQNLLNSAEKLKK